MAEENKKILDSNPENSSQPAEQPTQNQPADQPSPAEPEQPTEQPQEEPSQQDTEPGQPAESQPDSPPAQPAEAIEPEAEQAEEEMVGVEEAEVTTEEASEAEETPADGADEKSAIEPDVQPVEQETEPISGEVQLSEEELEEKKRINKYFVFTWKDLERYSNNIIKSLKEDKWKPDLIIGVARGGVIPAMLISDALKMHGLDDLFFVHAKKYHVDENIGLQIKQAHDMKNYDFVDKKVLLVDDVCDTGETLKLLRDSLIEKKAEVRTASVVYLWNTAKLTPDYYGFAMPFYKCVFPYSTCEFEKRIKKYGAHILWEVEVEDKKSEKEEAEMSETIPGVKIENTPVAPSQ